MNEGQKNVWRAILLAVAIGGIGGVYFYTTSPVDVGPPIPIVDPSPVDPPEPTPITPTGVAILILTDSINFDDVNRGQVEAIYAKACRDWADAHCDRDAMTGQPEFRVLDRQSGFHEKDVKWKSVVTEYPPKRYPWMYLSNGVNGTQGDVRNSVSEQISLYKKWGGE